MTAPLPPLVNVLLDEDEIDYKAWALDLCSLLDEIEKHDEDRGRIAALLQLRFTIAEKHGMKVMMQGPAQQGSG